MRPTPLSSLLVAAIASCGSGAATIDGSIFHDGGNPDGAKAPDPPTLGAQLDRAGRPGVASLLIGTFASAPTRTALQDAYGQASDAAAWKTTMLQTNLSIELELEKNLAVFDSLDIGMVDVPPTAGCQNAFRYSTPPKATSYLSAADLFADDQLYVDTAKASCSGYLALEIEYGSFGDTIHMSCGGRTLTYDTVDMTYSVLAAGVNGLDLRAQNTPAPRLHDNAAVHGDVKTTFPFLGPPH
jgi:hypothetical protein